MLTLPPDHILTLGLAPDPQTPGALGVPGELEVFFVVDADAFCGFLFVRDVCAGGVAPDEGPGLDLGGCSREEQNKWEEDE